MLELCEKIQVLQSAVARTSDGGNDLLVGLGFLQEPGLATIQRQITMITLLEVLVL